MPIQITLAFFPQRLGNMLLWFSFWFFQLFSRSHVFFFPLQFTSQELSSGTHSERMSSWFYVTNRAKPGIGKKESRRLGLWGTLGFGEPLAAETRVGRQLSGKSAPYTLTSGGHTHPVSSQIFVWTQLSLSPFLPWVHFLLLSEFISSFPFKSVHGIYF